MNLGLAGTVDEIKTAAAVSPIPVALVAEVTTPSFPIHGADAFSIEVLAASDGDVRVLIELQLSMDNTNFVEADAFPDLFDLQDEERHIKQITPVPAMYARIKMTGQSSNDASTTVQIKVFRQERT